MLAFHCVEAKERLSGFCGALCGEVDELVAEAGSGVVASDDHAVDVERFVWVIGGRPEFGVGVVVDGDGGDHGFGVVEDEDFATFDGGVEAAVAGCIGARVSRLPLGLAVFCEPLQRLRLAVRGWRGCRWRGRGWWSFAFSVAVRDRLLTANPAREATRPAGDAGARASRRVGRTLTPAQLRRVVDAVREKAGEPYATMVDLMGSVGLPVWRGRRAPMRGH